MCLCATHKISVTPTTLVYYNAFKLITHTDTNKHTHNLSLPLTDACMLACLPCVHTAYTSSVYHTCLCVPHAHTKAHVPECLGLLKLYVCARAHVHVYVVCHTYTHTHTLTFLTYRVECIEVHSSLAHYFDIIYREN